MSKRSNTFSAFVRILCAFALLSISFGHMPLTATPKTPSYSDVNENNYQYFLTFQICGQNLSGKPNDGKPSNMQPNSGCHACRLSGSMLPPPPIHDIKNFITFKFSSDLPIKTVAYGTYFVSGNGSPRAPPHTISV